ncbi:MAG: methylase [Candidatus Zixiibacteriota bacterium]|nr:MAG: methylase [candidate division Zixibacteria bacterium]
MHLVSANQSFFKKAMGFSRRILGRIGKLTDRCQRKTDIRAYLSGGRKPWSRGYKLSKFSFIEDVINDEEFLLKFRNLEYLPDGYGYGYDERVVEYPWVLSRLSLSKGRLLDAGSVFNFREIIRHPLFSNKDLTIFTLVPESQAFWQRGISYHYGDLRRMPFRDNWFDEICTISTLGHIGMDNRIYTKKESTNQIGLEAEKAVKELIRVLRPGGKILASVVFGKHQLIEWDGTPFAEQFDSLLLKDLLRVFSSCDSVSTSFYRYTENGWNVSTEQECQGVAYFNIHTATSFDLDNAAAARAVALIEVVK